MIDCLFRRQPVADGEDQVFTASVFTATDGIRSNWDPEIWDPAIQHGSPPLALPTKAIEELNNRTAGTELRFVARLTAWLLRPSDTRDAATDHHPPLTEGRAAEVSHAWEGAPGYLETVSWRRAGGRPVQTASA